MGRRVADADGWLAPSGASPGARPATDRPTRSALPEIVKAVPGRGTASGLIGAVHPLRFGHRSELRLRALRDGVVLAGLIFAAYLFLVVAPRVRTFGFDAFSYWAVDLSNPYAGGIGQLGWFAYSPALAQVASLFRLLPWTTFLWLWLCVQLATLAWLGGRRVLWLLAFPPVALELYHGNVNLLIAAALVLGFRYPAAWAFIVLAKVTPGVGLLWFAVRREWRALAIALGVTALVTAISFAVAPGLWQAWVGSLVANAGVTPSPSIAIPLWLRLPLAAVVVAWGARTDRRWALPVGVMLAMPALWYAVPAVLAAALPLADPSAQWRLADLPGRRTAVAGAPV